MIGFGHLDLDLSYQNPNNLFGKFKKCQGFGFDKFT